MASFVGYAIANNVGFALLSGTSARYRFYSRWGLSGEDISRVVLFYSSTYWLGLNVVGGWALAGGEIQGIDAYVPASLARLTGWLFLLSALAYPLFVLIRKTPICVGGVRIELPSMGLVGSQFLLSMLDWVLASAVLYVLVPAPRPDFLYFLGAFLAAQLVALISHVPGGLGVFESLMVLLLGLPATKVLPALAMFRVIYYLVPLVGALLVLIVDEISQRRHQVVQWGNAFGTLTASVAPKLLAIFTLLAGGVLLASAASPSDGRRLAWLANVLPLAVIEVSHFGASLAGALLLLAAWGLARRLADAYRLAVAALATGIVLSLLKGLDYETSVVLAALLVALMREPRRVQPPRGDARRAVLPVVGREHAGRRRRRRRALACSHSAISTTGTSLWWWVDLYGDMSRFLRASAGVMLALTLLCVARLTTPSATGQGDSRPSAERIEAAALARTTSTPGGSLVLLGDQALLWNPARTACLIYGIHGHTWVALGEPIGPTSEAEGLVAQFLERCDDYGGLPVVYQASKDWLHVFTDYGLTFVTLGRGRAGVPAALFDLDGSGHRAMRTTVAHLERLGVQMRVEMPPKVGAAAAVAGRCVRRVAGRARRRRAGVCGEPLRPALHRRSARSSSPLAPGPSKRLRPCGRSRAATPSPSTWSAIGRARRAASPKG